MMDYQKELELFLDYYVSDQSSYIRDAVELDKSFHVINVPKLLAVSGLAESYVFRLKDSWNSWIAAKAQAVPEGFVLVPKDKISHFYQDNDEPENFCSNESDFDCLGDCIDLGEIMEINKFTQAHVNKEILFGTWFAEAIDPSEKANFFVGTHAECLEIVAKNKAMIEAQEPAND